MMVTAIVLICLSFFTVGKIFLLLIAVVGIFKTTKINVGDSNRLFYFLVIWVFFLMFCYGAMVGLIRGNDLYHIVRNNFFTAFFIFSAAGYASFLKKGEDIFEKLADALAGLAVFQIFMYVVMIISPSFMVFYVDVFVNKLGYAFGFAGEPGVGLKLYSNVTPLYIFLMPYVFLKRSVFVSLLYLLMVLVSGSMTQYMIVAGYLLIALLVKIYCLANARFTILDMIFSFVLILGGGVGLLVLVLSSGLVGVVTNKIEAIGANNSIGFNTVNIRIDQARILATEIERDAIIGLGAGYASSTYTDLRRHFGDNKEINQSMYENQYLDILLKFGLLVGAAMLVIFCFLPIVIYFYRGVVIGEASGFAKVIGMVGLLLYCGSNGNTFYMYSTLFLYGMIAIDLFGCKRVLIRYV